MVKARVDLKIFDLNISPRPIDSQKKTPQILELEEVLVLQQNANKLLVE
jgi:hypothetical protein